MSEIDLSCALEVRLKIGLSFFIKQRVNRVDFYYNRQSIIDEGKRINISVVISFSLGLDPPPAPPLCDPPGLASPRK